MARGSKKENKSNDYGFEFTNAVCVRGVIRKILVETEKVVKYSVDVPSTTPKGNISHAFVNVTEFTTEGALEEGSKVTVDGHIATNSYERNGKTTYTTEIIAVKITELETE